MAENSSPFARFIDNVDPDALKVVRRLLQAGHEAYLVGGCVRDLYLGLRPKDFDIATSATPEAIRRTFRNSRIVGRRFKLAHVFFGPKIIETSTFRTAPPTDGSEDVLITHDNEWGSVEDDARRRDFTINGLFFDVETERVVDFVDGVDDLDGRLIRTIGAPRLRFREDPVRMIRAVKFAARLGFAFDPETWDALCEVAPDIAKCSRARVLEEIYKLMRSGASARSFELLLTTGLLQQMIPSFVDLFGDDGANALASTVAAAGNGSSTATPPMIADAAGVADASLESARLAWRYMAALDAYTLATRQVASNGVLLATMFAPIMGSDFSDAPRQQLDRRLDEMMMPTGTALGIARRDRELARQILMAHRRMVDLSPKRRRRASLAQRQYFHDALIFLGIAVGATGDGGSELAQWTALIEAQAGEHAGERNPSARGRRRRRGPRRREKTGEGSAAAAGESD